MLKLQLKKLKELRNDAYENSRIIKGKTKVFRDERIFRKIFEIGKKILLYNSCLHLLPSKLKLKWSGPFVVKNIYAYGAMEIKNPKYDITFKVNSQILKLYLEYQSCNTDTKINFSDVPNLD